jgi:hypothetical protein
MSFLDGQLQRRPLTLQTRRDILQHMWPTSSPNGAADHDLDWEPYFHYYENQCEDALHEQGKHVLVRTHQDIIDIASKIGQDQCRETIRDELKALFITDELLPDQDEILDNSIYLVARICSMVNVGTYMPIWAQGTRLLWDIPSLKDFLQTCFTTTQEVTDGNDCFGKVFTALNMQRRADMKICWTNNLADHLRVVNDDDKLVAIFHHASFLKYQKNNPLFPAGLMEETLRTLALLFPRDDKHTRKWLRSLPSTAMVDRNLLRCEKLRLDDRKLKRFNFWHDQLIELRESFDESRRSGFSQWWHENKPGSRGTHSGSRYLSCF